METGQLGLKISDGRIGLDAVCHCASNCDVMYRRERYEKEEKDEKKITQKDLDAVVKFINR